MASDQSEQHLLQPLPVYSNTSPNINVNNNDNGGNQDRDQDPEAQTQATEATAFRKPQRSPRWNPFRSKRRSSSSDLEYVHYRHQSADSTAGLAITGSALGDRYGHNHNQAEVVKEEDDDDDNGDNTRDTSATTKTTNPATTTAGSPMPWFHHSPSNFSIHSTNPVRCPTNKAVLQRRLSWVPITILVLAIYCTLLSGLYLAVAFWKPRYGKRIGTDGGMAPSTATLLSALFAKTIELSYVTVCVAFLGQVLSRRAMTRGSRGISISDMSMRAWIMQPGSLIVHWETVKYSALTALGVITLTATFVAMLYTTAAEALVAPKLIMGPLEMKQLVGRVYTKFANPYYLASNCQTPVTQEMDPVYQGSTCLQIEHVGQAYHNYQEYIAAWSNVVAGGVNGTSSILATRPLPIGAMYDNTSVTGNWIDIQNMTEQSAKYGRLVNNITAAMPHAGILAAAQDPKNAIRQPHDPSGEGKYDLEASVPSPAINVLCVGMTADELTPLVYNTWPVGSETFNATTWSITTPDNIPGYADWNNRTVVDDIFGFGKEYGQRAPIFGKLPQPYNTILNTTNFNGPNAIYLLAAAPDNILNPEYALCSLKVKQTSACSTLYSAAASGANFSVNCENPSNPLQYSRSNPQMIEGNWETDWKNVASLWASALSLGAGITDGEASNARLLTQMIPQLDPETDTFSLNPNLPSISEALAVMAGSTLILSSQDAPFVPFWNYSKTFTSLKQPEYQIFNASLRAMNYASGPTQHWQGVFYVILVFAFLTSALCLVFMIVEVRGKQVTDFTEPQNLFALAMNSPATARLQGACGAGPYGTQLKERWYVGMEEDHEHYYIGNKAEEQHLLAASSTGVSPYLGVSSAYKSNRDASNGSMSMSMSNPMSEGITSVSVEVEEEQEDEVPLKTAKRNSTSPRVDEYRKLAARKGFLARLY